MARAQKVSELTGQVQAQTLSLLRNTRGASTLRREGQPFNGPGGAALARRRYQRGSLTRRERFDEQGHINQERSVWVGRWREDVIEAGVVSRVHRREVLGTLKEYPTRKLALRELERRLSTVNSPTYRARPTATFAEFASRWEATVLVNHKPSTQATIRSHLRKYLVPFFGLAALKDIEAELVQQFISSVKANPKTVRNLFATLSMMWNSARAWAYVAHNALEGVVLPKRRKSRRFFFTVEELQRIIRAAEEPYRTFYWLAAESGLRAGELCGLRVDNLNLEHGELYVCQSVWRGQLQDPKTENSTRRVNLSPELTEHLRAYLLRWRPNELDLLFATRRGTPWDANLVVKRKLRPLLRSLGIENGGLHAFRHGNETLMDRLGTPLKVRQQRLGHSDPRLTLSVYTHVAGEDEQRVAAQLGKILCPVVPKPEEKGPARFEQALVN